ncbi:MAG: ABC transporter substrate-binding protein [Anaerolineae bacterium]|nr:ABC transporter substrate-binding protein [Anaerolineae bacterium]
MYSNNKRLSIGLLVFSIAVLVLSVGGVGAQGGGTLRVGILEPVNLDPATGNSDDEVILNRHIYDYLIEILPEGSLVPSLAESWDISDDGLTYTFNLVEGATFHDGSAFTAEDVVFTFNRMVEVGSSLLVSWDKPRQVKKMMKAMLSLLRHGLLKLLMTRQLFSH